MYVDTFSNKRYRAWVKTTKDIGKEKPDKAGIQLKNKTSVLFQTKLTFIFYLLFTLVAMIIKC